MLKRLQHFKQESVGWYRLHLVASILLTAFLFFFIADEARYSGFEDQVAIPLFFAVISFICYWSAVRIILWILDGFKQKKLNNTLCGALR
jgi:hypothetical protein